MKKNPIPDNVKEEVLEIIEEFNRSGFNSPKLASYLQF